MTWDAVQWHKDRAAETRARADVPGTSAVLVAVFREWAALHDIAAARKGSVTA